VLVYASGVFLIYRNILCAHLFHFFLVAYFSFNFFLQILSLDFFPNYFGVLFFYCPSIFYLFSGCVDSWGTYPSDVGYCLKLSLCFFVVGAFLFYLLYSPPDLFFLIATTRLFFFIFFSFQR